MGEELGWCEEEGFSAVQTAIRRWGLLPVVGLGLATNALNAAVFSRRRMREKLVNQVLMALTGSDVVLLVSTLWLLVVPAVGGWEGGWLAWTQRLAYPLGLWAQTASVYLILAATAFRFLGVCRPFKAQTLARPSFVSGAIVAALLFSAAFALPRFLEISIQPCLLASASTSASPNATVPPQLISAQIQPTALSSYYLYQLIYSVMLYTVVMFALPFGLLIFLSVSMALALYRAADARAQLNGAAQPSPQRGASVRGSRLRSQQQHTERRATLMLLGIAGLFLLCSVLPFISNILQIVSLFSDVLGSEAYVFYYQLCVELGNLLVALNSSVYFFVYLTFNREYREILGQLLCLHRLGLAPEPQGQLRGRVGTWSSSKAHNSGDLSPSPSRALLASPRHNHHPPSPATLRTDYVASNYLLPVVKPPPIDPSQVTFV